MTANRPDNFHQLFFVLIAAVLLSLCTASLTGCGCSSTLPQDDAVNPVQKVGYTQYVECGMCGAHVLEWWHIRNDANTEWVNVCILCVQKIDAETE